MVTVVILSMLYCLFVIFAFAWLSENVMNGKIDRDRFTDLYVVLFSIFWPITAGIVVYSIVKHYFHK